VNLKEYIESGILEAYALGELDPGARQEVESKIAEYPELDSELIQIEVTMESLMMRGARNPAARVRELVTRSVESTTKKVAALPNTSTSPLKMWRYATAASLLIAVTTGILAFIFWSNWKRTETDLEERIALSSRITQDFESVNNRLNKIEGDLNVYDNPQFERIVLKGTANAPNAIASVYWNQTTEEVFLNIQNLKKLSQESQYQLWAIVAGQPVDMGIISTDVIGLIKMNQITGASAFAITIEPRGGRATPTLETMQVIGST
jgi:anti-sigma-K factor RskA